MEDRKYLVTRSSIPPYEEYCEEIKNIFLSHWLTNMGEKHIALERQLREYLGVEHITLFVNGHMALELAIQALGLTGEVITTPFTFASTTHAIVRNGLTPVFCDIDPFNYTMDPQRIEELITEKTSAIIPVHVYGNLCDVAQIESIAKKHGLRVIYDAAHAFGETLDGVGVGRFGDASMFSFHATKVFNTIEGGAVCFADEALEKPLYNLKNFGIRDEVTVDSVGSNAKLNEFSAAMGICNLRHIDEYIALRKTASERYRERLDGVKELTLCEPQSGVKSNYAYFPVLIDGGKRDGVYERLKERGVFARRYFYPLTSDFVCYQGRFERSKTPTAKRISNSVLTLPMYSELTKKDVDYICDALIASL